MCMTLVCKEDGEEQKSAETDWVIVKDFPRRIEANIESEEDSGQKEAFQEKEKDKDRGKTRP